MPTEKQPLTSYLMVTGRQLGKGTARAAAAEAGSSAASRARGAGLADTAAAVHAGAPARAVPAAPGLPAAGGAGVRCTLSLHSHDSSALHNKRGLAVVFRSLTAWRGQHPAYKPRSVVLQQAEALSQLELLVDGPFGAPAVAYSRFPVVLLVGAGVGVTPFLSMLADAVEQHARRAAEAAAGPPCSDSMSCSPVCCRPPRPQPPAQQVHFHWLVREPTVPR